MGMHRMHQHTHAAPRRTLICTYASLISMGANLGELMVQPMRPHMRPHVRPNVRTSIMCWQPKSTVCNTLPPILLMHCLFLFKQPVYNPFGEATWQSSMGCVVQPLVFDRGAGVLHAMQEVL